MAVKMSLEKLIQRGLTAMKFATPLHVFTCSGVANFIAASPRCLICQLSCQIFLEINPKGLYQSAILKRKENLRCVYALQKA